MGLHRRLQDRHILLTGLLAAWVIAIAVVMVMPGVNRADQALTANLSAVCLAVAAAVATLSAARTNGGHTGRGWLYICLGTTAWAIGEALWTYYENVRGVDAPFPSLADVSYLIAYPLLLAGMLQIAIPRRPAARLRTLLDASVIALIAAAVAWAYVLEPIAYAGGTSTLETMLGLAYPVGDLLLVFGLAVATLRRPREQSGLILGTLGLGLTLFLIADFAFAILSQSDSFASGSFLDVIWIGGYGLLGASALWQQRWRVAHETDDQARVAPAWRQAIPLALLLPAFAWAWAFTDDYSGLWTPALLIGALALVIARSILTMSDVLLLNRELDDGATRLEAANQELSANGRLLNKLLVEAVALSRRDSLTGLLNHASITEELALAMKDHPSGVVVAMLDVDEMKRINDEGGHQAGDEALRLLAKLLESQENLVAGRYGGDEFLVFRVSQDGSLEALEHQIDEALGVLATHGIGVSYGVASYPVDALEMTELVDRADNRLYRAKRTRKQMSPRNAAA